jgi:hypothetical protein
LELSGLAGASPQSLDEKNAPFSDFSRLKTVPKNHLRWK